MSLLSNLLLILSLLFNWTGNGEDTGLTAPTGISPEYIASAVRTLPDRPDASGTHFEDMEYEHYDPEVYYDQVDVLYDLTDADDMQGVCAQYDLLYREFCYIDSLYVLADIQYSADLVSDYWAEESLYCADLWAETANALSEACRYALESPLGESFAEHIGPEAADSLAGYESLSDRESELYTMEAELINEYYAISNNAYENAVYTYMGREWTYDMITGYRGDALYNDDYEGYLEVYYGLDKQVNDLLGPLFMELLAIRAETAELMGYDSFADYAYEASYGRDFTTEDAQTLCDAVKPLARDYYDELYYSDVWYAYRDVTPVMDADALLDALGSTISHFGPELEEVFAYMKENQLYLLSDSPDSQSGAYTTELNFYRSPFIYAGLEGDCYDFSTLTHEFGHFADSYYTPIPNILTSVGSFDLFEIHSTGLEVLYTEYYDQVFSRGVSIARFITLGGQIENIIDGCLMDEFQRRIYADPDMTLEEINHLYAEVCAEYGIYQPKDVDYTWVDISHNFDSPLYYLSYAVSSLASLQLWDMAQEDMTAAVDSYLSILGQSAYDDGYMQVLENAGLRLFTEDGAVEDICRPVLDELKFLDKKLLH